MVDERAFVILESTPGTLREMVSLHQAASLDDEQDEGWSVRHVVAHIYDVDAVIYDDRIRRILEEEKPFIRSIDPLARMAERGLLTMQVPAMVDELAARREAALPELRKLTEVELSREGTHDEAGTIFVSDLVHQWAYHDLMHLKQAASILQAPVVAGMGNTRKFYDL